ncbi:MAG: phosphate ABC transporter permease subunit PstC [Candidatus Omnitrophica bacterium]|nr:phosphate ABC transporter permease subunit PstC [Candidatus Omnitrophota bacterium]
MDIRKFLPAGRQVKDNLARRIMFGLCLFVLSLAFFMVFGLYQRAKPILAMRPLKDLLFSGAWHPTQGQFGLASFITGTLWVTTIAMGIAVPLGILTAIYLSEYAHRRTREFAKPLIDLLAGISPVVYGVWGVIAIVPLTGFSALTGGIVLAVMAFPIIISIVAEVIRTVPFEIREASSALGATKWQTIKFVVLKKAWPGIIAAVILGLSRAFGETMAVLMVAGCSLGVFPKSVFDPAYPLPALIANTYGEMMSIPLYDAAVLLAAFVLLLVTIFFNMVGWSILLRIERREAGG